MVQRKDPMEQAVSQRTGTGLSNEVAQQTVLLSSCYLAPIDYYALLDRSGYATIEIGNNYQKQTYQNRCHIAGANGMLTLSIPVMKPAKEEATMRDIRIADHGNWQHLHWNAIVSAYRSTPFFQYYEDEFRPLYEKKKRYLHDFNEELRLLVCRLIGIETEAIITDTYTTDSPTGIFDSREIIHPKRSSPFQTPRYYQVFANKNGFIPGLSIIDLLFNMGNESGLILRQVGRLGS